MVSIIGNQEITTLKWKVSDTAQLEVGNSFERTQSSSDCKNVRSIVMVTDGDSSIIRCMLFYDHGICDKLDQNKFILGFLFLLTDWVHVHYNKEKLNDLYGYII